jgi:ADP-L-glycero-D-manno-heptose 6-epimerase
LSFTPGGSSRSKNRAGYDDILVVDSLSRPHKHLNLGGARFSDYLDKDEFLAVLPSLGPVEAIFHQGACSDTTEQDGRYMMMNNFSYSKKLLHHCLSAGVPLIYASSAAVYGHGQAPFSENGDTETPLNVYGFSKLVFDRYVRRLLPQAKSQVLGLRYFNVYGPREAHKGHMASLVFKMFLRHREGKPLQVFEGSGEFRRDFIHVDDVVGVNLHFLETGQSGILNCGSGQSQSFQDLADLVKSESCCKFHLARSMTA